MELHKLISDALDGKACVLTFDDLAIGPDKDITACTLSALNFARLAFEAECNSASVMSKILASLCSKTMIENAVAISREWPSGLRAETEDVYHIPLFEMSLKLVSTDYDSPSPDHIATLLENLRAFSTSSTILVTRYPNVVACVRLQTTARDVFVLYNPRVSSKGQQVASLTFCTSPAQIVQRLCEVFPLDKTRFTQGNLDWQARLVEKCAGLVFVPRASAYDSRGGEEVILVSSLTLLTLRTELAELTRDNGSLKKEKQKLEKSVADFEAQLVKEKEETKRIQSRSSRPLVIKPAHDTSVTINRGSQFSYFAEESGDLFDSDSEDEIDPSMELALRLQASFDTENETLLKQRHELIQTAQRQYHCGVCLDDFPEDDAIHIDACGHDICRYCARGHVCIKIEEHRFPVLCPVCMADGKKQDPGTISGSLVQLLGVSEKQWEIWVEMEISQHSIAIDCRKCHHSGFVAREDLEAHDQSEIHCPFPACDHVWCKKCQQTIEPGGATHSCDGASELDHLVKQQGWRYCPNCKTPIQKISGCNHLSCVSPGCNTHFCYRCGNTINRTAIPREIAEGKSSHFRNCPLF